VLDFMDYELDLKGSFYQYTFSRQYMEEEIAGYAYTFVYKQHFFLTLSLSGGLGGNYTRLFRDDENDLRKFGLQLNTNVRASFGYNSSKYFAGVHYVNLTTRSQSPIEHSMQTIGAGNFRISLAKRFGLKRQLF